MLGTVTLRGYCAFAHIACSGMRRNSVIQMLRVFIQILIIWVIHVFQVRKLDNHRCEHEKGCADHPTQPAHITGKGERPREVRGLTQTIRTASIRWETGTQVPTSTALCQASSANHLSSSCQGLLRFYLLKGPAGGCPSCPSKGFIHQGLSCPLQLTATSLSPAQ